MTSLQGISWIGEGKLADCNTVSYKSVAVGHEKYLAGDYVLLHGIKNQFICRLTGFVRNMTDGQATAHIEWLYWPGEMTRVLRSVPAKKRPRMPGYAPREVFLSNSKDSAGIESIACKVSVIPLAPLQPVPQLKRSNQFYARWHWNVDTKKLTPVKGDLDGRDGSGRKSWLSAVIAVTKPDSSPSPSSKDGVVDSPRAQRSKFSSSELDLEAENTLGKELSISLSRSPISVGRTKGFLAAIPNPDQPMPKFSSPLSTAKNDGRETRCFKSKSLPQKPLFSPTAKTPEQVTRRNYSICSAHVCTIGSRVGVSPVLSDRVPMNEHPLPCHRATCKTIAAVTERRGDRKRTGDREKSKRKKREPITPSSLKRRSRLNTCDVVGLLSADEEEDDKGEEEFEEPLGSDSEQRITIESMKKIGGGKEGLSASGGTCGRDILGSMQEVPEDLLVEGDERDSVGECSSYDELRSTAKRWKGEKEEWNSGRDGSKGFESVPISEDILSSPTNLSCNNSTCKSEATAARVGKKWSLRTKSRVKPPTYLAASTLISKVGARCRQSVTVKKGEPLSREFVRSLKEERGFTKKRRKRQRSLSPARDLLVEEPAGKKIKDSRAGKKAQFASAGCESMSRARQKKTSRRREEIDSEREREVSSESSSVKTPQGKMYSLRPHTVPRNKSSVEDHTKGENTDRHNRVRLRMVSSRSGDEWEDGGGVPEGRSMCFSVRGGKVKSRIRERSVEVKRTGRSCLADRYKGSEKPEETDDEYEPCSDVSDSGDSREEEEQPYIPASFQQRISGKVSNVAALESGAYWSPDCDFKVHPETRRTPRPLKRTPKRTPRPSKISKTPATTPAGKTPRGRVVVTPHIPQKKTIGKVGKSDFDKARLSLHVSAVPHCLPCRETEFADVYAFVEDKLSDGTGGCMYISGVPGTGKTATVREVARYLREAEEDGSLPHFTFVEINGMRLTEPRQAYASILKQLTGQQATPDHAASLLDDYFAVAHDTTTVVLADELDLLWTRKQSVLYHLFDWPTRQHARLVVLAVANTMDLPERIMMNRVASRLGLTRLTFQPYTFQQLQEIVASRMADLDVFEADAMQLAARKVAAVSGDARRALDICRRATELAAQDHQSSGRGRTSSSAAVNTSHINRAVQEMFSSPKIVAIRSASAHEQMFLRAVLSEFRRTGLEETTLGEIYTQMLTLCRTEGLPTINTSVLSCVCARLCSSRLLLTEGGGRRHLQARVRLNMSQDDVIFALRDQSK